MTPFLLLLIISPVLSASIGDSSSSEEDDDQLFWENCMMEPTIELKSLSVTPTPIEIPGQMKVTLAATIHRPIANVEARVDARKHMFFGLTIPILCINNMGSCTYKDVCNLLQQKDNEFKISAKEMFRSGGLEIACPIPAAEINIIDYTLTVPDLPLSILAYAIQGKYKVETNFYDSHTNEQLGCIRLGVGVKAKGSKTTQPPPDSSEDDVQDCSSWWC